MTSPLETDGPLILEFPKPGERLKAAFHELFLTAEGSPQQKRAIKNPDLLPRPWDPPSCHEPELRDELWDWLDQVVAWVNHEYVWDPATMIPPCWPLHPHLVHEIAVLADQRRRAGIAPDSNGLEEWHRYSLPGFLDRMQTRLKNHCDQDHQPWPARSRYARYQDDRNARRRQAAFNDDARRVEADRDNCEARPEE